MSELEIEIKAHCSDLKKIEEFLIDSNASYIKKTIEKDTYYNHPSRDFGKTDEALRVRIVDGKTVLTYKGKKLSTRSKARFEKEVCCDDGDSLKLILTQLGFVKSGEVEKIREYYSLDGVEICLDSVKNLGSFVELECKGTDIEETEGKLFSLAEKMGLRIFETRSYLELLFFQQNE